MINIFPINRKCLHFLSLTISQIPTVLFTIIIPVLLFSSCKINEKAQADENNLSGEWAFQIDSFDVGIKDQWFAKSFNDKIILPGSMLTNGKGFNVKPNQAWTGDLWDSTWIKDDSYKVYRNPEDVKISFWLQPEKYYVGAAWYKKTITIPEKKENEKYELYLERCHWETQLWIDSIYIGMNNSLSTPHVYELPNDLIQGKHQITLRIDNRIKEINPGPDAHSISDNTQTNWNGVIGDIKLRKKTAIYMKEVAVHPNLQDKSVNIRIKLNEIPENPDNYKLKFLVKSKNKNNKAFKWEKQIDFLSENWISVNHKLEGEILLWDEYNPNLYTLQIELEGIDQIDKKVIDFGFREFTTNGRHFFMNGRRIFLRGTLECAIFPKTGYPSTDVSEWKRILTIAKNHGLNHIRFHSWCPPEAAFQAADLVGMYLAVECGAWTTVGDKQPIDDFVMKESERIVSSYGNHPSFCLFAYGNEPHGDNHIEFLTEFVKYWKKKDNRRLFTTAFGWANIPENDFQSSADPRIQHWQEGLASIINSQPPSTYYDWSRIIEKYEQPTISHEIGQWCVYPNIDEIKKYDGPLKAKNFEIFRDRLEQNKLLHLADSFRLSSGKLQVLCYKADIEAALRTADLGGFQLLDLRDFPGQGSAIVGILDPFWDEKGYITPNEFKQFCSETVPLARMKKLIFTNNENLDVDFELSHYGKKKLEHVKSKWKIVDLEGKILLDGNLPGIDKIPFGLTKLANISIPLHSIKSAKQVKLILTVGEFENHWNIWVFPSELPDIPIQKVWLTEKLDQTTLKKLSEGESVLLSLKKGSVKAEMGGKIGIGFSSIFWNTSWTNRQLPHTLGILCNPSHPIFNFFPTNYHSDYQWWDSMMNSSPIMLNKINAELQPIVRVIDDWFTARSLALIFECKVGKGRLIISGIDFFTDIEKRIEAKQLLFSIKSYMNSDQFNPENELNINQIRMIYE